jgi:hypothetical protein
MNSAFQACERGSSIVFQRPAGAYRERKPMRGKSSIGKSFRFSVTTVAPARLATAAMSVSPGFSWKPRRAQS